MAVLRIPALNQFVTEHEQILNFLAPLGVQLERWPLEDRCAPDADDATILAAYAPEIDRLKRTGGYVTADVINVTSQTPGLEAMLARFNREHTHTEDEVRFIVKGRGIFHFNPGNGAPILALEVEAGDWFNVPAGTRHWFDLCADRTIRAIRLFQDPSGWTPHYCRDGRHTEVQPLCWGPTYLSVGTSQLAATNVPTSAVQP
jgi:1,2-dihydroxy-3-keto-5-methylthiopentene dioxygenase